MTANQIEYSKAVEAARHNQVVEDETIYHNRQLEEIETVKNDINDRAERFNEEYQTRVQSWKEQYDNLYLEWQKASTSEKLNLERQMNEIKAKEQEANANYQRDMADIQRQANTIKSREADEINRHNKEAEAIQREANANQKSYWDTQSSIGWYNASTQRKAVKDNWTLTMDRNNTAYSNLILDQSRFDWEQERAKYLDQITKEKATSEEVLNYSNAFSTFANAGTQIFKSLRGDYGKKTKQEVAGTAARAAFDALFK